MPSKTQTATAKQEALPEKSLQNATNAAVCYENWTKQAKSVAKLKALKKAFALVADYSPELDQDGKFDSIKASFRTHLGNSLILESKYFQEFIEANSKK